MAEPNALTLAIHFTDTTSDGAHRGLRDKIAAVVTNSAPVKHFDVIVVPAADSRSRAAVKLGEVFIEAPAGQQGHGLILEPKGLDEHSVLTVTAALRGNPTGLTAEQRKRPNLGAWLKARYGQLASEKLPWWTAGITGVKIEGNAGDYITE